MKPKIILRHGETIGDDNLTIFLKREYRERIGKALEHINKDILEERIKQDMKFGGVDHPNDRWLAILGEEFGELCQAILESDLEHAKLSGKAEQGGHERMREEAVQVAAVAIAFIECLDKRDTSKDVACRDKRENNPPCGGKVGANSQRLSTTTEGDVPC